MSAKPFSLFSTDQVFRSRAMQASLLRRNGTAKPSSARAPAGKFKGNRSVLAPANEIVLSGESLCRFPPCPNLVVAQNRRSVRSQPGAISRPTAVPVTMFTRLSQPHRRVRPMLMSQPQPQSEVALHRCGTGYLSHTIHSGDDLFSRIMNREEPRRLLIYERLYLDGLMYIDLARRTHS